MNHLLAILLVGLSIFKVEMVYTGEPEWRLWGNPTNITYNSTEHVWSNANTLSENWRWSDPDRRDELLKPERVPEKKRVSLSINSFWKSQDNRFELPLMAVVVATTKKNLSVNRDFRPVEGEEWTIDRESKWYKPRETFCPITRALADNDEANVLGYPGSATRDLILSIELERRERNRCARWRNRI